jgi:hypothetical protein
VTGSDHEKQSKNKRTKTAIAPEYLDILQLAFLLSNVPL